MTPLTAGVLLALAAAAALQASYALQARQARRVTRAARPGAGLLRALIAQPVWLAAIALTAVAFGLQVLALRHVPLAVVQPVLALGLMALLAVGARVLGERVGAREIAGAALIVAGVTAVVIGAPPHSTQVRSGLREVAPYVLLALALVVPFASRIASRRALVAGAAAGDVLAALSTNRLAAALSTSTALVPVWLAISAVAGIAGITSETAALQRMPATRVAPIVMGADVTLPVAISALDNPTNWSATPGGGALLAGGVLLVGLGAVLLGRSRALAGLRGQAIAGDARLKDTPARGRAARASSPGSSRDAELAG